MPSAADLALSARGAGAWRFAQKLRDLGCADVDPIAVAVSGGPDSLALLLLARAVKPYALSAATVDHGLRSEAADEARAVAALCDDLGVPHTILRVDVGTGGGLQAAARDARYAALAAWCPAPFLLTAHQRDDVAEAVLMRLARGAGVRGLARMAEARPLGGVMHVRPLLDWSRADLLAVCAEAGVQPSDDPSNADPRFDRARARALLARTPWLAADRLARAAANLAEADAALAWFAEQEWSRRFDEVALTVDAEGLPHDTRRRFAERAIAQLTGARAPLEGIETLLDQLGRGRAATLAGVRVAPGPPWRFALAPPRRQNRTGG